MIELIIYLAIGACAGTAQYIIEDRDYLKIMVVSALWWAVLLIGLFLIVLRLADR